MGCLFPALHEITQRGDLNLKDGTLTVRPRFFYTTPEERDRYRLFMPHSGMNLSLVDRGPPTRLARSRSSKA